MAHNKVSHQPRESKESDEDSAQMLSWTSESHDHPSDSGDESAQSSIQKPELSVNQPNSENPPLITENISILTLNCWGVFVKTMTVAKTRRLAALREALKSANYDIVLLQELWENKEYAKFKEALSDRYPYSVYFHSQVFGAGLSIFSRWKLESFLTYPYTLDGYPHHIHHADWLSGKSMGYTTLVTPKGFRLNLYITHTHARYDIDHKDDIVEGHRLAQAMELMEFVRATAGSADAIFIGGDLNLEPYTTALNLLKRSLNLKDAWLDQLERQPVADLDALELEGCTCENKYNPFSNKKWTATSGNGLRLDYLLYRPGVQGASNVSVVCDACHLEMREIPGEDRLHYSDHDGVAGYFRLSRHSKPFVDPIPPVGNIQTLDTLLGYAITILNKQISRAKRFRAIHLTVAVVLLVLVFLFGCLAPFTHPGLAFLQTLIVLLVGAIVFAILWGNLVGRQCELSALRNMVNLVEHYLDSGNQDVAAPPVVVPGSLQDSGIL